MPCQPVFGSRKIAAYRTKYEVRSEKWVVDITSLSTVTITITNHYHYPLSLSLPTITKTQP
jgi:hypothetical protein